jgi:1-acyl-sn-glycerol-3-phosphate acyltransferase
VQWEQQANVVSKYLKSIWFFLLIYVTVLRYFVPLWLRQLFAVFTGRNVTSREVHQGAVRWGQHLFSAVPGWKVTIRGKEYLPTAQQSYVIVANHESAVDILVLYYLGLQFRWLAKDSVFKLPVVGQAMRMAGYIPVTRGNRQSHKDALARSAEVLRDKVSMLFFPEGTRSEDGVIKPFKAGAFVLAKDNNVGILPIVLAGTRKLLRKRSLCPFPAEVQMEILAPVYCGENESVEEFTQMVEQLIKTQRQQMVASS